MTEHGDMGCAEFADVAAELALGVLTGRERAAALAHLEHCDVCQGSVQQLTTTGEELLGLLPVAEPPAGFETRVLARLGWADPAAPAAPAPARPDRRPASRALPRRRRLRRLLVATAAAMAVAAAALGGWGLRAVTSPAGAPLASAVLLSASHQPVGTVYLYSGSPSWMYMSVDMPSGEGAVICQLKGPDGQFRTVGSFRLAGGYGNWVSPEPVTHGQVTGARLIMPDGTVLATASFS